MIGAQDGKADRRSLVMHLEDDESVRAAMRTLLAAEGHDVLSFSEGTAALRAIEDGVEPELLIVDYHLAGDETGTDVAESITRRLRYPVPLILLTGDPANCEVPWLTRAPVWLLPKPPDTRLLMAGIGPLVQFTRAARARV